MIVMRFMNWLFLVVRVMSPEAGGKGDRCIFSLNNRGICGKMKHNNRGVLRVSKWGIESIFGFFGVSAAVLSVAVFFGDPTDLFVRCD